MVWAVYALTIAGLCCPSWAGQTSDRSSVQAATNAAIKGLKEQVDRLPLGTRLTVGQYLDAVRGHDFMLATLQKAQLIGGARVLGDRVVQVRLDISGQLIADALTQIAAINQRQSPYSGDFVAQQSRAWSDRTFTATGISTGEVVPTVTSAPPLQPAAQANTAEIPTIALDAAKRSAASGLISAVAAVDLPQGHKGKDLISLTGVSDALTTHVLSRPVKSVEGKQGGEVRVRLLMDRLAFFNVLKESSMKVGGSAVPADEASWSAYREPVLNVIPDEVEGVALPAPTAVAQGVPSVSSQAPAPAPQTQPNSQPQPEGQQPQADVGISFPIDPPPAWFFTQIDAGGSASNAGSKLLTARAAEADALQLLGKQLEMLELKKGLTLGDAARKDPRFGGVLSRGVERARVYRVEYFEDGSARVRVSTDTRYIWQDLVVVAQTPR